MKNSLTLVFSLLPALSFAAGPAQKAPPATAQEKNYLTTKDVIGMAAGVGMLGASTVDATVGEVFVRAYPSKKIAAEGWDELDGSMVLSCDTYRNASGNHYVAGVSACHIGYQLVAKKAGYTLTGPFKPVSTFEGRSCDEARKVCSAYTATLTRNGQAIEIREKNKLLGTVNFAGQTPQYSMAK